MKETRREILKMFGALPFAGPDRTPEKPRPFPVAFLMYHEVFAPALVGEIRTRIDRGEKPLSLPTLGWFLRKGKNLPEGTYFLVTCHDGRASQFTEGRKAVDELIKKTGVFIPLNLFVITKFDDPNEPIANISDETPTYSDGVNRFLTKGQVVQMLKEGHVAHNHTVNHDRNLPQQPETMWRGEIETAEMRIQALYDLAGVPRQVKAFAYPYGRVSSSIETFVSERFDLAFATDPPATIHQPSQRFSFRRVRRS